ncbi:protein argonaute 4-like [Trifolium pratense]|uniref:Protein argonaute 4-like n=1 Tax=Trifolium pratense TaxID=57577 RepID=A0A2K3NXQ4_TRIPR|nr:protein argonaute 4-like [Trifolium pratense]
MGSQETEDRLLPPPPVVPSDVNKHQDQDMGFLLIASRPELGSSGAKFRLLTNHFKVNVENVDGVSFNKYKLTFLNKEGNKMKYLPGKGALREILDRARDLYSPDLDVFAYDGEQTLFTIKRLENSLFRVDLENIVTNRDNVNSSSPEGNGSPNASNKKRQKASRGSKNYVVEIRHESTISLQEIADALKEHKTDNNIARVLDIILRQHAAEKGCLLVRQNFFQNDICNLFKIGAGVTGCRGHHPIFRNTQSGLSLNIDVSSAMSYKPGDIIDFVFEIQQKNKDNPESIDWPEAGITLQNLRMTVGTDSQKYKITGLSEEFVKNQKFTWKKRIDGEVVSEEITVWDYFTKHKNIVLYKPDLPCINVGKPGHPTYFPMEWYTKPLTTSQRSSFVENLRQKPEERKQFLIDTFHGSKYDSQAMLHTCGISIRPELTQFDGRKLTAPWKMAEAVKIEEWAVVNFSSRLNSRELVADLIKCGETNGIFAEQPFDLFDETHQDKVKSPSIRVKDMLDKVLKKKTPKFLVCLLCENNDIYGPWKKACLSDHGIFTQCLAPRRKRDANKHYLANVLLKINVKLGGMNSLLAKELSKDIPIVSKTPTLILGMDVSHGSPGQTDIPSIAAVVSSRHWPKVSKYRAWFRTQKSKVEMIEELFKLVDDKDEGLIRQALDDFCATSGQRPENIIIFRDGVSDSQFSQVLDKELTHIIEACQFWNTDKDWHPKFLLVVAQKNHHTRFFQSEGIYGNPKQNIPPGIVVDNVICHPTNYDFYMCAHAGKIGTSRPTHYHVLWDDIKSSPDDLQELVHSLSYVYQRGTTAISVVAPIRYAHLAASQVRQFMKCEDTSETNSSHGDANPVPQLPQLHKNVCDSMFFV